jgi:CheY-like chemotaxis protein
MPKEILIADANVAAQEDFERILEGMDAQLIFAENGEDALLKIKLYKPDLVIADVTMPNKDGAELCRIVKANQELKHIPFVLLAGIFEDIEEPERQKAGADGVITKPLKEEEVLPLLGNLLKTEPVKLRTDETARTGPPDVTRQEILLSEEEPSLIEGLDEPVSAPEVPAEAEHPAGGEDEGIIELTDVVDEEPVGAVSSGEHEVDQSFEQMLEKQEEISLPEEGLDEISLDGIELDEPKTELELGDVEPAEDSRHESATGDAQMEGLEELELSGLEEGQEEREETVKPPDEGVENDLDQEIDRRIDLVLEEEVDGEEEDTLLDLETMEGESAVSGEGPEMAESSEEKLTPDETPGSEAIAETTDVSDVFEEDRIEAGPVEDVVEGLGETELTEDLSFEDVQDVGESERPEPVSLDEEVAEEPGEPLGETIREVAEEAQDLSLDDLEGIEEPMRELEDLPMDEEMEKLLDEGTADLEEIDQRIEQGGAAETSEIEEFEQPSSEEAAAEEDLVEEPFDEALSEKGAESDIEPEGIEEESEGEGFEEVGEAPLEELEEDLGEPGDLLEEPFEEAGEDSGEAVSYPRELINEGRVSEEELSAFQKRLRSDFERSSAHRDLSGEASDIPVESVVRRAVEHILENVSESVVPELTKAIVQVASSRIEELVQRVVPDLAESAIKREIERLQKGN